MTEEDVFKFDVRVRERLQRRGLVSDSELKRLVDGLPDLLDQAVTMDVRQPALDTRPSVARGDGAGASSVAARAQPPVPIPAQPPVPPVAAKPSLGDALNEGKSQAAPSEPSSPVAGPPTPKSAPPEAPAPQAASTAPQRPSFSETVPATVPTGEAPALEISESAGDEDEDEDDVDSSWGTDS